MCSLGMVDSGCEGGNNNQYDYTRKKKALFLIDCINEYNGLGRATKDFRSHLRDTTVA